MKRTVLAVGAVFVLWSIMDFVIHGLVLATPYALTPQLWRPMGEMKMGELSHFFSLMPFTGSLYG